MELLIGENMGIDGSRCRRFHTISRRLRTGGYERRLVPKFPPPSIIYNLTYSRKFESFLASDTLAAAETAAYAAQRHASRSPRSTSSYPAGTEFALAAAEAQLMSAVIGVLSESVVEAMKAFYKMRSAFKTLEGVSRSIEEVKAKRLLAAAASSSVTVETTGASVVSDEERKGLLAVPNATATASGSGEGKQPEFKNAVDEYIESGGNLCYGTLLLLIGMIPPAMSKLLSILGFHGGEYFPSIL